jgi:hypothetical protein
MKDGKSVETRMRGRIISRGEVEGEALTTREPLSFLGGIDPETGKVVEEGHELEGASVKGKILIFPKGKGSTVGSYVLYQLKKNGAAPRGILNVDAEEVVALGAIISEIPMMDRLDGDLLRIPTGTRLRLNAEEGFVEVLGR